MIIRKIFNELMEKNHPTFTVVIDHTINWYETTKTFEEALRMIRELVEADHHHIFINVTEWRAQSYGKNATIACHVQWIDSLDGSRYSKTIRVNGIVHGDCDYSQYKKYES